MKSLVNYILIFCLFMIIWNCDNKDYSLAPKSDFIKAGETETASTIQIQDTIYQDYGEKEFSLDINNDNIIDLIFVSHIDWYFGGMMEQLWSTVQAVNTTEILVDSSMKQIEKYSYKQISDTIWTEDSTIINKIEVIPLIVEISDIINRNGEWLADTAIKFCYSIDNLIESDISKFESQTVVFKGWNNKENKYLGYRIISDKDTLIGWLNIKIEDFHKIIIYNAAYR